ncbi:MAG: hypothetical protein KOO62_05240 [candidate division Zixibacteria bacterium]|nr:hypothetical protein [candidate division Zixibacteria bacterium]
MISFIKKYGAIHPVLFGVFPVLFLFAQNANELVLDEVLDVLWGVAAISLGVTVLFTLVLRNLRKGALFATLSLMLFFSFGHVKNVLPEISITIGDSEITSGIMLLVFWILLLIIGGWSIVRQRRELDGITSALNVIATVLVLIQIWGVGSVLADRPGPLVILETDGTECDPPDQLPDIYYIVCDAYTRSDVLKEVFDHDNSEFLNGLEDMGFYVVDRARSNYPETVLSLVSSLNLNYADSLDGLEPSSGDRTLMSDRIRQNTLTSTLRNAGYDIVAFETGHYPTEMTEADVYISGERLVDEFEQLLLSTTPVLLMVPARKTAYAEHRDRVLAVLDKFPLVCQTSSPKFVFAHILCPHPPFVFDAQGNHLDPEWPFTLNDPVFHEKLGGTKEMYRASYADQLAYLNSRLTTLAQTIIERSSDIAPVIIFQGDHGTRSRASGNGWNKNCFREKYSILNALYMPGIDSSLLHDRLTPVNTFRLILNEYLGCSYDMLPNQSFYSKWKSPYLLTTITREALTWGTPDEVKYDDFDNLPEHVVKRDGMLVTFSSVRHNRQIELGADRGRRYDLYFCRDQDVVATVSLESDGKETPGRKTDTLTIPEEAILDGFDNILLVPIRDSEGHCIGSLRLM